MTLRDKSHPQRAGLRLAAAVLAGQVLAYLLAGLTGLLAASGFFVCYLIIRFIIARRA
ncbi:MAG: hypothetical protein IBX63_11565 [Coriobacteriia bacterium]|nr:hypothetical protein [Coriobacteriia bacterium]